MHFSFANRSGAAKYYHEEVLKLDFVLVNSSNRQEIKAVLEKFSRRNIPWHPSPPFFYGWIVLGTASIGALIATSVAQTVFGGVQDLIAGEIGWDRKTIALAATLGTWTS